MCIARVGDRSDVGPATTGFALPRCVGEDDDNSFVARFCNFSVGEDNSRALNRGYFFVNDLVMRL